MTGSTEELLRQRARTHGEYAEHADITQRLMGVLMSGRNWADLPPIIRETLHMTAHKQGRIVTGNPFLRDHYDDISGYNTLVSQRLEDGVGVIPFVEPRADAPDISQQVHLLRQQLETFTQMVEWLGREHGILVDVYQRREEDGSITREFRLRHDLKEEPTSPREMVYEWPTIESEEVISEQQARRTMNQFPLTPELGDLPWRHSEEERREILRRATIEPRLHTPELYEYISRQLGVGREQTKREMYRLGYSRIAEEPPPSLEPWRLSSAPAEDRLAYYQRIGEVWTLRPLIDGSQLADRRDPGLPYDALVTEAEGVVLFVRFSDAPPQYSGMFSRLYHELNHKEWSGLEALSRALYVWHETEGKYILHEDVTSVGWAR